MTGPRAVLRLADVVKTYPGVVALRGATLEVVEGEVHAVVGENGAGKSTLMAVAAGSVVADPGTIEIGDQRLDPVTPATARALGLAVVYQHPSVLDDLTVTENMVLAMPRDGRPAMSRAGAWASERLAMVGADIDPEARASDLSVAEHQLLEIAKALALDARVLILDEPTESLTAVETEHLFERIGDIRSRGAAVVYISHRLPEVMRVADRVTVMRDGATRGTLVKGGVSEADVLRLIVGRSIDRVFPPKGTPALGDRARPLLEARRLSASRFHDVSLDVRSGEIVGLAGVEGNGQRDVLRALAGLAPVTEGSVVVDGRPVRLGDPARVARAGLVHLPGDRHREGVFLSLSVRANISLPALPALTRRGLVQRDLEDGVARTQVDRLAIRTPSVEASVDTLSGGNQQKVLIARSMVAEPRVLLADEPTRGVDVGARVEIYRILRDAAESGQAVVVHSSDAIELQGLCDRVLVFSRGRVIRELDGDTVTEDAITGAAVTATAMQVDRAGRGQRPDRWRRFLRGDYAPSLVLLALILLLAAYTASVNDRFLSERNLQGMLLLASALAFVSLGQQVIVLAGGLDLSVGAVAAIVVIAISSFVVDGAGAGDVVIALVAGLAIGAVVGLANGFLVRWVRLPPVLATLASLIVLQGIALLLRPQPGGMIDRPFTDLLKTTLGPLPISFLVALIATLVCEWALRRTRVGLWLRAVGSDEVKAHRTGAPVRRTWVLAFVACSMFAAAGGLMLSSQVGIGDARLGGTYALTSITAVVLGGASIFGGRGSFVGAFLGACLLQTIFSATTFLSLGTAWQYWLPGILVLLAAGLFSRARGIRAAALAGEATT